MVFSTIIPTFDFIPIKWELLQVLLIITFILHIIFVNILIGSIIILFVETIRLKNNTIVLIDQISKKIALIMAITINTGVAPLLFLHVMYGPFIFTSSVLMSVWWLSIVIFLIIAYSLIYILSLQSISIVSNRILIMSISIAMLLIVGFIISNNMTLMLEPKKWLNYFNVSNGMLTNFNEPMLIPRYLHFLCASIGIGGLFLSWLFHLKQINKNEENNYKKKIQYMKWFIGATITQIPIGIFFLFSLKSEIRNLFIGQDFYKTFLLGISLITGLLSVIFGFKNKLIWCTVTSLVTISLMSLVRDQLRKTYLIPFFNPEDLIIKDQYNLFILFLILGVIVILVLIYILRIAWFKEKGIS